MTLFMIVLAVALAPSGSPSFPELKRPVELSDPGLETFTLLDFAGSCVEDHPQWGLEGELDRVDHRYWSTAQRNEEVWGSDPRHDEISGESRPFRCRKGNAAATLRQIDQALDAQDVVFARATAGIEHGVWIGSLKLCKGSVLETWFGTVRIAKQPALFVKLTPQANAWFASLTRNSVNRRLAIRLEGSIISRPTIYEPIEDGFLQITGPDELTLRRARSVIEERDC